MAPPRKVLIHDDDWAAIVSEARSKLRTLLSLKHPNIFAKAKQRCESGMMANAPCDACLFKAAKSYGLEF